MRFLCFVAITLSPLPSLAESISFSDIEKLAVGALKELQPRSIEDDTEYCGWVLYENGQLKVSKIRQGQKDRCRMVDPPPRAQIVASFHTHGGHDQRYYSEVPSLQDMLGDFADETYGFVGTPGGRVWLVDPYQKSVYQLCGEGCIPKDENYDPLDSKRIPKKFSPNSLHKFLVL